MAHRMAQYEEDKEKDEVYADEMGEYYPNEPTWASMFPRRKNYATELFRDRPDFTKLKPNDPMFLDMQWPEKSGPEATAYAAHMQWKRRLSDSERLRWQKWAVYKRIMQDDMFDYAVEDFVYQSLIRDLKLRAGKEDRVGRKLEAALWDTIARGLEEEEAEEVRAVVLSLYSAINRANFNEIQTLYLPDESVELTLPGFATVKGFYEIDKMWRRVVKESKPFGSINAEVVAVRVTGFSAVVHIVECIKAGTALRKVARKDLRAQVKCVDKVGPPKRVFSTLVLRKWNNQWRVQSHHAARFSKSSIAGDDIADPTSKIFSREALEGKSVLPALPDELHNILLEGGGSVSVVSRISKEGEWEPVSTIGDNGVCELNGISVLRGLTMDNSSSTSGIKRKVRRGNNGIFDVMLDDDGGNEDQHVNSTDNEAAMDVRISEMGEPRRIVRKADKSLALEDQDELSVTKLSVRALRTLANVGSLCKEQKELLLTDIIDKVSNDQISLVETAYDLLVIKGGGRSLSDSSWKHMGIVNEAGLEEFADQCRIIADNILTDSDKDQTDGEQQS